MSFLGLSGSAQGLQNWGNTLQGGAGIVGGIASIASGIAQGNAYDSYADYARGLSEHNAQVAITSADAEVHRIGYETSQRLAVLRSEVAGSGVQMSGTPLALLAEEHAKAVYEKQSARYAGKVNAQQARFAGATAAFQYETQADSARSAGIGGLLSGFGEATGSFLQIRADPFAGGHAEGMIG